MILDLRWSKMSKEVFFFFKSWLFLHILYQIVTFYIVYTCTWRKHQINKVRQKFEILNFLWDHLTTRLTRAPQANLASFPII
jgi:hypothetical protein